MARRRGKQTTDDTAVVAPPEVEGVRHAGPWDSSERSPADDQQYIDLGPLKVCRAFKIEGRRNARVARMTPIGEGGRIKRNLNTDAVVALIHPRLCHQPGARFRSHHPRRRLVGHGGQGQQGDDEQRAGAGE